MAIEAEGKDYRNDRWRKVYGKNFPPRPNAQTASRVIVFDSLTARNTEEFIEDRFPVDIRYDIELDCEITQNGFRPIFLQNLIADRIPLLPNKKLRFFIQNTTAPEDSAIYWKVLNRGRLAVKLDCIRGQISLDNGRRERIENTNFKGDHIVECYAIQNGVVVAKDRLNVSIANTEEQYG